MIRSPLIARTLALLLVFLTLMAGLIIYAPIMDSYLTKRAMLTDLQLQLKRLDHIVASGQQPASLTAVQYVDALIKGGPSDAPARLQQLVRGHAQKVGIRLNNITVQPSRSRSEFEEVTLRINTQADYGKLMTFLASLESDQPLILIRKIAISPRGSERSGSLNVSVQIDLFAFTEGMTN